MAEQLVIEGIGRSVDPEAEFFPTPAALCTELCAALASIAFFVPPEFPFHPSMWSSIIEPSAGDGAFVAAAKHRWPRNRLVAIDIRDTKNECKAAGADEFHQWDWIDFCKLGPNRGSRCLIIGNPPFSQAEEHIEAAHSFFASGTAIGFLLRLGFLGSVERKEFWRKHPPFALWPIVERPNFTGSKTGSDSSDYGLFLWVKGYLGPATLMPGISWK